MSRTFKDKPNKASYLEGKEKIPYIGTYTDYRSGNIIFCKEYWYKDIPGYFPKKRKEKDTEDHWMSTPGWWVKLTMNKPQRRAVHLWEHKALLSDLEELVTPVRKVGHVYFW